MDMRRSNKLPSKPRVYAPWGAQFLKTKKEDICATNQKSAVTRYGRGFITGRSMGASQNCNNK